MNIFIILLPGPGTVIEPEVEDTEDTALYPEAASLRPVDISVKVFDK